MDDEYINRSVENYAQMKLLATLFWRIHPERCTNHIKEMARKTEPHVLLPTRGGSSPTKQNPPPLHEKKEKAQEI
jgi:hypothetical protein